jgi:hypothetical protein
VQEAEPRPGELVRLEGERGRQSVSVTVRPLELPVPRGDISHAQLPVFASTHADALRREHEEIRSWLEDARRERDEARAHGPARSLARAVDAGVGRAENGQPCSSLPRHGGQSLESGAAKTGG